MRDTIIDPPAHAGGREYGVRRHGISQLGVSTYTPKQMGLTVPALVLTLLSTSGMNFLR